MLFSVLYTIWIKFECGSVYTYIKHPVTSISMTKNVTVDFLFTVILTLAARPLRNKGDIKIIMQIFLSG